MLQVDFKRSPGRCDAVCFVCNGDVPTRGIEAQICHNDEFLGVLCEECVIRGDGDLKSVLQKRAERIREEAQFLFDKADSLEMMAEQEVHMPSWATYKNTVKQMDDELEERLAMILKDIEDVSSD